MPEKSRLHSESEVNLYHIVRPCQERERREGAREEGREKRRDGRRRREERKRAL